MPAQIHFYSGKAATLILQMTIHYCPEEILRKGLDKDIRNTEFKAVAYHLRIIRPTNSNDRDRQLFSVQISDERPVFSRKLPL